MCALVESYLESELKIEMSNAIHYTPGKSDKIIVPEKPANKPFTGCGAGGGKGLD